MNVFHLLAVLVLILHLLFLGWVLLGWLLTRRRPWLRSAHIISLFYGIAIETGPWPCPLTLAENYFLQCAGIASYHQPFVVHYLEALVYPDVSPVLLTWCAVAVCGLILIIYVTRFRRRTPAGW
jgi:Flp pilus assembly protein protease CpaA